MLLQPASSPYFCVVQNSTYIAKRNKLREGEMNDTKPQIDMTNFKMSGYLFIHKAMRQDALKLEAATERLLEMSADEVQKLAKWFEFFWEMVETHHVIEDDDMFPKISVRDTAFQPNSTQLTQDHRQLHDLVDEIQRTLASFPTQSGQQRLSSAYWCKKMATDFRHNLSDHLDREEASVVPSVAKYFSLAEQVKMTNETLKLMPTKHLSLLVPWIFSALTEAEIKTALSEAPLPIRVMYRLSWRRKYEKFSAIFR
jgi:hemerythrin-like domain-containing protein